MDAARESNDAASIAVAEGDGDGSSQSDASDSLVDGWGEGSDAPDADPSRDATTELRDASAEARGSDSETPSCAGFALGLDGRTYARLSRPVQDDFTLEAWIKTATSRPGTNVWEGLPILYSDVAGPADDFGTSILNPSDASMGPGHFGFFVGHALGTPDTDFTLLSTSIVTTNEWVHVAVTRKENTGTLQLLVNGTVEGVRLTTQRGPLADAANMVIGANPLGMRFFVGLMDEVSVWDIVRSPTEIAATMHQRLSGAETGLVGYWRFDDAGSSSALDSSPRNAATVLIGSPVWVASDAPVSCFL